MMEGLKVHRSVKTRLEAGEHFDDGLYMPKIRPNLGKGKGSSKDPAMLSHGEWNVEQPAHWEWVH